MPAASAHLAPPKAPAHAKSGAGPQAAGGLVDPFQQLPLSEAQQ